MYTTNVHVHVCVHVHVSLLQFLRKASSHNNIVGKDTYNSSACEIATGTHVYMYM